MSEGLWNGGWGLEPILQARLTRHKLLTFGLNAGALDFAFASGYGEQNPNLIVVGSSTSRGAEGGPHFILSPETPDGRPTLGFEWCLVQGINAAVPDEGGFTVTIWVLITPTMAARDGERPVWAAMDPLTGVGYNELYHSFDTNATAIRFQITNFTEEAVPGMTVALSEL